jgi:hypothetical protein
MNIIWLKDFKSNNKYIHRVSTVKNKSESSHEKCLETKVTKLATFKELNSYQEKLFSLDASNRCDQIFEMLYKKKLFNNPAKVRHFF